MDGGILYAFFLGIAAKMALDPIVWLIVLLVYRAKISRGAKYSLLLVANTVLGYIVALLNSYPLLGMVLATVAAVVAAFFLFLLIWVIEKIWRKLRERPSNA